MVRLDLPSELVVVAARDPALVDVRHVAPELARWHAGLQGDVELVAVRVPSSDDPWPLSLVVALRPLPYGPQDVVLQGMRIWAGSSEVLQLPSGPAVATARVAQGEQGAAALVEVLLPMAPLLLVLTVCSPDPERLAHCASLAAAVAERVQAA